MKQMLAGATELDICAAHDEAIVEKGHLSRLAPRASVST